MASIIDGFRKMTTAVITNLKIIGGTPTAGKVWTSTDTTGIGSWQTPAGAAADHLEAAWNAREAITAGNAVFLHNNLLASNPVLNLKTGFMDTTVSDTNSGSFRAIWMSANYSLYLATYNPPKARIIRHNESAGNWTFSTSTTVGAAASSQIVGGRINDAQAIIFYYNGSSAGSSVLCGKIVNIDTSAMTITAGTEVASASVYYQTSGVIECYVNPTKKFAVVVLPQTSSGASLQIVTVTFDESAGTMTFGTPVAIEALTNAACYGIQYISPSRFLVAYGTSSSGVKCAVVTHDESGGSLTVGTPVVVTSTTSCSRAHLVRVSSSYDTPRFLIDSWDFTNANIKVRGISVTSGTVVNVGTEVAITTGHNQGGERMPIVAIGENQAIMAAWKSDDAGINYYAITVNLDLSLTSVIQYISGTAGSYTAQWFEFMRCGTDMFALVTNTNQNGVAAKGFVLPKVVAYSASAVSGGASGTVTIDGLVGGQTSLVIGKRYHARADGTIVSDNTGIPIGPAVSTTQLKLQSYTNQAENFQYIT